MLIAKIGCVSIPWSLIDNYKIFDEFLKKKLEKFALKLFLKIAPYNAPFKKYLFFE